MCGPTLKIYTTVISPVIWSSSFVFIEDLVRVEKKIGPFGVLMRWRRNLQNLIFHLQNSNNPFAIKALLKYVKGAD